MTLYRLQKLSKEIKKMDSTHILILPMPFQGHIMPLMEMAHHLIDAGFTVTFVNTDFNHRRLLSAAPDGGAAFSNTNSRLRLFGISDGMSSDEERKDVGLSCKLMPSGMSPGLESIVRAAAAEGRPIQWILADFNMAWAFALANQMGLRSAAFCPPSAAMIAVVLNFSKMIEIGLIAEDGSQNKDKDEMFQLAAGIPTLHTSQLPWNMLGNSADKSAVFSFIMTNNRGLTDHAEFIICNTFMDLEPQAISLLPSAVPIGPLFPAEHHPIGHLWPPTNSSTIMDWLDSHSPGSVLYIAFGSHAIFDQAQVDELAHGIEMTGRPFLWAVRPDLTTMDPSKVFSTEFLSLVQDRGLLVGWAPQLQVLGHPSIGCFMSHCGWNSTMEGIRNGMRFLCWPYFTDQFLNQSYICDIWMIGLRVRPNEEDVEGELGRTEVTLITRKMIRERVEEVMGDDEMRKRALMWKERALQSVSASGSSYENFKRVVDIMKTRT
ncbi:hypothetical protein M5K25_014604 [Dendrobium thyrsiflorum]|uniref:Uncharacterized protein n=1 Tax=Dendrobium thyrsiflorum TaxID=117978 RepID=A0ABD0UNQ9_DENTH